MSLTKEIADKVCTAVLIGYSKEEKRLFEYHEEGDKGKYESVQNLLKGLDVDIDIGKSVPKDTSAVILTKDTVRGSFEDVSNIEKYANIVDAYIKEKHEGEKLYGAYIGGIDDSGDSIKLLGVSQVELYNPEIRQIQEGEVQGIKEAYEASQGVYNDVYSLLKGIPQTQRYNGIKFEPNAKSKGLNTKEYNESNPQLFKSYHGMVRAISDISSLNRGWIYFEIAASDDTTKVSSCFPCATFMLSTNGAVPSSTHLGRGDNWNIPSSCPMEKKNKWKENIKRWYKDGKETLEEKKDITIEIDIEEDNYPELFLESLTFESSFTNKVTAVL